MKIATMVRGYLPVPRPAGIVYAPIDLAMAICEGMVQKGHEVTYYGPKGSHPPGKLRDLDQEPLARNNKQFQALLYDLEAAANGMLTNFDYFYARDMFERARKGEFDLLHFHHPDTAVALAPLYPDVPVVYTLHDPLHDWKIRMLQMHKSKNQFLISLSDSQRRPAPKLPYIATVHNGIHLKDYTYSEKGGDYLLFAGRIVPEKGIAEAVRLANKLNEKLLIAGPITPGSKNYFNKRVKPHLNDRIRYLGHIEREEVAEYMQGAKAFLMPVKWEEPFGVGMIEAMASGTPVIALNRGSISEIVKDGVTGFIVKDMKSMAQAIGKINTIKRRDCRDHVEQNFSIQHMVDGYERAFQAVLEKMQR